MTCDAGNAARKDHAIMLHFAALARRGAAALIALGRLAVDAQRKAYKQRSAGNALEEH
jgi:hypothetical protein